MLVYATLGSDWTALLVISLQVFYPHRTSSVQKDHDQLFESILSSGCKIGEAADGMWAL